ncbi:hypothetical protein JHK85_044114 [Glycine max]|nr:hypothetical protein JHK85_044114 [Glycine max]
MAYSNKNYKTIVNKSLVCFFHTLIPGFPTSPSLTFFHILNFHFIESSIFSFFSRHFTLTTIGIMDMNDVKT